MRTLRNWLRALVQVARRPLRRPASARPAVELLEDRRLLSTAALSHSLWRGQRYTLSDQHVVKIAPPKVQSVSASAAVNSSFGSVIGLDKTFASYGYRGTGYTVAVIDSGIDYRHADLGGGFGAGKRVVAGYDFVNGDADPMDDNGHGTHIAGIIGGSSATYSGIAPNVRFVALKVLDKAGSGSFGHVEDALRWVINNQAKYNIVAVNLSLGASNYTSNPYTFLEDEFSNLKNQGVFTAVAAGNDFYTVGSKVGLSYPAISPAVVSVGATWNGNFGQVAWGSGARDYATAADRVASFSQRSSALDLMAPGAIIYSTYLGGAYQNMAGTSMATPVVAGAAVLLHQALDAKGRSAYANQDYILHLMKSTGVTVKDGDDENDNVTNTGLSFKRLNLYAALNAVGPAVNVAPTLGAIANQTIRAGGSLTLTLPGSDANGDALTYTARVSNQASLAYQLDQQLGLTSSGSYFTNSYGSSEKWLTGTGGAWYCILPSGEFRKWAGTMTETLKPANLLATFGAAYYADPSLLWNAQPAGTSQLAVKVVGNQLTLSAPAGLKGTFTVEVTVSDGKLTAKRSFTVSIVANSPPVVTAIGDRAVSSGAALKLPIQASDANGDRLRYSARIVENAHLATLSWSGTQVVLTPNDGHLGTFTVEVNVYDGYVFATQRFTVTVRGVWTDRHVGDVNGDGKDDIFNFNSGDGTWWIDQSTPGGFVRSRWVNFGSTGWTHNFVGDVNGDGKSDIINYNSQMGRWYVGVSTGSRFAVSLWATSWATGDVWQFFAGDFTGNRKTDVVAYHKPSGQWWAVESTGSAFVTRRWATGWSTGGVWDFHAGDFNGDGKQDVAAFHKTGQWWAVESTGSAFVTRRWATSWSAGDVWDFHVGDFNGDGKDDVAAFHETGQWWVARSTGSAFQAERWATSWATGDVWAFVPGDFTGNGRTDLGAFHTTGQWWLAQSSGSAFAAQRWGGSWATGDHWNAFLSGDFDGDGRSDVAALSTSGEWWLARSTGTSFQTARWTAGEIFGE